MVRTTARPLDAGKPARSLGSCPDVSLCRYSVEELKEFAKDNDLLVSGSKKELIKRILAWFDGDKENTTHEGVKAAKEAKKAAKAAKQGKKGKAAPATTKKAAPAKEEPADLELDLDNLDQYDLHTLKAYCKEEKIAVKGTKKSNYIKAIEDYNDEADQ